MGERVRANLRLRFPGIPEEDIEEALRQCNGHGGKATALLAKSYQPAPAVQPKVARETTRQQQLEEDQDELSVARELLEPYQDLDRMPVVPAAALAELRDWLPDVPEATLIAELLRQGGDLERAKGWLWGHDQGAGWRRNEAIDVSAWVHVCDDEVAMLSGGPWTKKRLVLSRPHMTYAYTEEATSQFTHELGGRRGPSKSVVSRTLQAGGKWAVEVQSGGFLLVAQGSVRTCTLGPEGRRVADAKEGKHELLLWTTVPPFPDLEDVEAVKPDLSKAARIKRRFREIDRNHDGLLQYKELKNLLTKSGKECMSDGEVRVLFDLVDQDGDGLISFDEFVDYLYPPEDSERPLNAPIYRSWYDDNEYRKVLQTQKF